MPSLVDVLTDPFSLAVFAIYAVLMLWEWWVPARTLPDMPGWRGRGLAAFALYFLLAAYLPLLWTEHLLPLQWFDLSALGMLEGVLIGLLIYELVAYTYHRGMHASNMLWRGMHQMHHSAERLDTYGAFWFHPFDMIGWAAVGSVALTLIVGLSAQATTVVLLIVTLMTVFQHMNVRTPQWLGYVLQRPESHSWHHARGLHRDNYADLPLIDLVFGTFRNPRGFAEHSGFHDGASLRLGEMLIFRDVSQAPGERSR